ncbi:excreted/secreted protein 66 [Trypanosoma theileri]|uniref:Excreted/secreted protein 66 n=1 Tax=Trypanosoma theileri TaxID=67003 RepID=A0A1X0NKC7_9TRYP|nr:excreted/secreted protein 66 [Trypanosoma theileri]ORC84619.1 excreted/secreted protein 66 [Trypanosoma theileri]
MVLAYIFDGESLYQVYREGESLKCHSVVSPIGRDALVACFGEKEFYFVEKESPDVLRRYRSSVGCMEYALPGPVHKLLVHHEKVYCCGEKCLYGFDPLSGDVEIFEFHQNVLDIVAAGHGFVFVNDVQELFAFHFNQGITKVSIERGVVDLLGRYNHFVIALINSNSIRSIDENGEVRENLFPLTITNRFISVEEGSILTSQKGGQLCLYSQDNSLVASGFFKEGIQLLSVPLSQPEDCCSICLDDFENDAGVTLDCGHRFHKDCVAEFSSRANSFEQKGEHVVFTYAVCPRGCGFHIRHTAAPLSAYMGTLWRAIHYDSKYKLREMPSKTVEDLLYYICHRCKKPFFGGEKWCFRSMSGEPPKKPTELLCSDCNDDFICPQHKHNFVLYKCRYCCNPATHMSFGNRYLCDRCNSRWENTEPEIIPCPGPDKCPLLGSHECDGSYPLGCMLCMSLGALGSCLFSTV